MYIGGDGSAKVADNQFCLGVSLLRSKSKIRPYIKTINTHVGLQTSANAYVLTLASLFCMREGWLDFKSPKDPFGSDNQINWPIDWETITPKLAAAF